jgi:hypothetical protein
MQPAIVRTSVGGRLSRELAGGERWTNMRACACALLKCAILVWKRVFVRGRGLRQVNEKATRVGPCQMKSGGRVRPAQGSYHLTQRCSMEGDQTANRAVSDDCGVAAGTARRGCARHGDQRAKLAAKHASRRSIAADCGQGRPPATVSHAACRVSITH